MKSHKNDANKKSKTRMIAIIAFIFILSIICYIFFRGTYLQMLEIGENYESVFIENIRLEMILFIVSFIIVFITTYVTNKIIMKALKKFFDEEKKDMPKLPNKSIAFVISVIVSLIIIRVLMKPLLLIVNSTYFGITDPIFNLDIAFYMFQKPFIESVLVCLMILLIARALYLALYYIIVFNIYFDGVNRETLKKSAFIKQLLNSAKILIIIFAVYIFINTQNILFEKMLTLSDSSSTEIYGAGLVSVTIKLWGYRLLSIVLIASVFNAIRYFKKKNTKKIIISLLTVPCYLVGLFIIMVGFQIIAIKNNELDKQKTYIAYNIENTRNAYDINVEEIDIENSGTITLEEINDNQNVIDNSVIVNKDITLTTLGEKQTNAKYYSYRTSKIGLYNINGENQLVYVSPREIVNSSDSTKYEYTHGFGDVITSAVSTDETGNIKYIQKSFDGSDEKIDITQPRIYFGLDTKQNIITNLKNKSEYDYPISTKENAEYNYDGKAGIKLNFIDRLILGITTGDIRIAFTNGITENSKILVNRNIIDRVKTVMPYLLYDNDPYQVITDEGKLVWVLDAYTISSNYPYSQITSIEVDGVKQKINYIRNSVKVIIDAYDGTTKFYIVDRTDPIAMAYRNAYPTLFVDLEEQIPEDILKHMVYPEYLFNIQAEMIARYHNVKTDVLYRNNDVWQGATHTISNTLKTKGNKIKSYYTMVKTIDEDENKLALVLPYTLLDKQNLKSYLIGTYDSNISGKLTLYKFSDDSNVLGPMQLDTQIEQDEEISNTINSLNVTGTKIIRDMIIVPINNTLLYIEPIYQVMINETEVPVLKNVIVASGNKVSIGENLKDALKNLLSQYAVNIEVINTDNINDLIEEIIKANKNLETSTNNGDWEMVGKDLSNLQELISKLEELRKEENKNDNETINSENTNKLLDNILE